MGRLEDLFSVHAQRREIVDVKETPIDCFVGKARASYKGDTPGIEQIIQQARNCGRSRGTPLNRATFSPGKCLRLAISRVSRSPAASV